MDQEQTALLTIAVMAALSDQQQNDAERAAIANAATGSSTELAAAMRAAQSGESKLDVLGQALLTPEKKRLAFEVATAVCNADGASNAAETAFLDQLRTALGLGAEAAAMQRDAAGLANTPLSSGANAGAATVSAAAMDKMIFDAAVLNGALELLPESLASMAILPLQMKLVYRIAKAHNYDLGREHIRDFVATLGVGLTAQYLEGFARKLLGGLLGGLGRQTASSGMAFVSTYAIGQAARRYYAGGRQLEALQLRETYQSMLGEAKTVLAKAQSEIQARVGALRTGNLADVVKSA